MKVNTDVTLTGDNLKQLQFLKTDLSRRLDRLTTLIKRTHASK